MPALILLIAACYGRSRPQMVGVNVRIASSVPSRAASIEPKSLPAANGDLCPPLDPPSEPTVTVSTVGQLQSAVNSATSGDTILIQDGTYALDGVYLRFDVPNVTLRSASGNRESVVLDGNYITTEIIQIVVSDITIADLTLREAYNHPIHVMSSSSADTTGTLIYNVHIVDPRQQAIKINPYTGANALYFPDDGVIACSHIELTDAGRPNVDQSSTPCYTGGVDAHQARDWVIRDNLIEGFWCESGLSEHGIHLWRSCRDTLVERNELRNNARGIGFGLVTGGSGVRTYSDDPCPGADGGYVDHYGGSIRNNFVFANDGGLFASEYGFDCGICLWNACGARALHNTVVSTQAPFSSIEWFLGYTDVDIINNLVSHNLRDRGGTSDLSGNLTYQPLSLFVDGANGDLHLTASASAAIDQVTKPSDVSDDFDGGARPAGAASDVGADEYGASGTTASLSLTAPTGTTAWPIDGQRAIRWTTSGSVPQVDLSYSTNSFVTSDTVDTDVVNVGVYTWTTPSTPTQSAQVRVVSSADPSVQSTSAQFTLYDPSTLTNTTYLPLALNNYAPTLTGQRIYSTHLAYQGAFACPSGEDWAYGGHALAYYPEGDPTGPADGHPGSLYVAAHAWHDLVGEITIPAPVRSDTFEDLPTASVLRSPTDITAGWKDNCTYNDACMYREVDGLAYLSNVGKIVWNLRDWYNVAAYDQDSLGWSNPDMTGAQGVWHIGERPSGDDVFHNAKTCNYLFKAPQSFGHANLEGKWLIAGNHREAGALGGSQGPTLYALAPWEDGDPPGSGQNLGALALLYYPEIYPGCLDNPTECHFPDYRPKDTWGGGAWVQTAHRSGVLIFGRKGLGDNCYGTQAECSGDPCDMYKGYHAYPYEPQILFYDPAELSEVAAGTREPWEVLPYEVYSPTDEVLDQECATFGAAAYDGERGLIYATEPEAGPSGETVVHVWGVRE